MQVYICNLKFYFQSLEMEGPQRGGSGQRGRGGGRGRGGQDGGQRGRGGQDGGHRGRGGQDGGQRGRGGSNREMGGGGQQSGGACGQGAQQVEPQRTRVTAADLERKFQESLKVFILIILTNGMMIILIQQ